ncbi:MAG TPA: RidA family protein, partial [Methylomirabilota bacterium]|nr:RidA family protein [Methylomirabilota bacterium]
TPAPTFVVAGAGEMRERGQGAAGIVRHGETSPEAMREKAGFVMGVMRERMKALGAEWDRATAIDVYAAESIHPFLVDEILRPAGGAAIHGVRWYPSRPPVQGLEFEVDVRGVRRELVV